MYQALYRKWRPRSFDDVSGQEHITETLKRQVSSGKLSHAYLFTGTRGTGKTSCAKILSKAVNCENPVDGNPCNMCHSCKGIDSGNIMDVTEMDAASNNGVDNVRALREEAVYLPTTVKKRVYIIDEVHMLTGAAFNALLKILEEPPEHLLFILATTELHKVPATILSRCQKYSFKRILPIVIKHRIEHIASEEGFDLTDDAAELLARLADGSLRDACSLLDQCSGNSHIDRQHVLNCIGIAENDEICHLLSDILNGDGFAAINRLSELYSGGKDVSSVLNQLTTLHRDILLTKLAPKGSSGLLSGAFSAEDVSGFSQSVSVSRLLTGLEALQLALGELDRSVDRKIAAEVCLLRLCEPTSVETSLPVQNTNNYIPDNSNKPSLKPAERPAQVKTAIDSSAPEQKTRNLSEEEHTPAKENNPPSHARAESDNEHAHNAQQGDNAQERSWKVLLKALVKHMDNFLYGILEDASHAEGKIVDSLITICAKSPFSLGLIDTTEVKGAVKTAAESIWSGAFIVKVEEAATNEADTKSKLEKLSRFGNIKFE